MKRYLSKKLLSSLKGTTIISSIKYKALYTIKTLSIIVIRIPYCARVTRKDKITRLALHKQNSLMIYPFEGMCIFCIIVNKCLVNI